jgi:hypothetical protein
VLFYLFANLKQISICHLQGGDSSVIGGGLTGGCCRPGAARPEGILIFKFIIILSIAVV